MKSGLKKGLLVGFNVIIWLMILVAAVFIFFTISGNQNADGLPRLFGYSPMTVLTPSMKGDKPDNFVPGDLIIIKTLTYEEKCHLEVGQIITFTDSIADRKQKNTHRIHEVIVDGMKVSYITKGDNNEIPDPEPRVPSEIIGLYTGKVAGLGNILDFFQSKWGFFYCLVVPLILFFFWRIYKLFRLTGQMRKEKKQEEIEAAVAAATAQVQAATSAAAPAPEKRKEDPEPIGSEKTQKPKEAEKGSAKPDKNKDTAVNTGKQNDSKKAEAANEVLAEQAGADEAANEALAEQAEANEAANEVLAEQTEADEAANEALAEQAEANEAANDVADEELKDADEVSTDSE